MDTQLDNENDMHFSRLRTCILVGNHTMLLGIRGLDRKIGHLKANGSEKAIVRGLEPHRVPRRISC